MVKRQHYLDILTKLRDQKLIKVITGLRRVGKSTLLLQFREELRSSGVKKVQIQSYNFEDPDVNKNLDWRSLYEQIATKLVSDDMNYIFLDEIQAVPDFEKLVDGLFIKENVDLYITGSNAFLLSGELATYLTGRFISLHILPYSFAEYRQAFPENDNDDRLFTQFLQSSALPEAVTIARTDPRLADNYLTDLYQTVIEKDIKTRFRFRSIDLFGKVYRYALSTIGSPVSVRNIAGVVGGSASHVTVADYLEYMTKSYLLYPAERYDLRGKKILTTNNKYYAVDLGLRNVLLSSSAASDAGHRLENAVFLELLRRNEGKVMVGKLDESEVDFVIEKPGGARDYYQVALHASDDSAVLKRELAPLQKLRDNHPKTLLSLDLVNEELAGIKKQNVVDWMLGSSYEQN